MTQQYGRALRVTLGGQSLVELNGDASACLRVRFSTVAQTIAEPGRAIITISNPSDDFAKQIIQTKQYTSVSLSAGYIGNAGVIFQGKLVSARNWRESPLDNAVILSCADGQDAFKHAIGATSLAAGHTPMDQVKALVKTMEPFGITSGYMAPDLSILTSMKYPRGVPLFGQTSDLLRTIGRSFGFHWSVQRGVFQMVGAKSYIPGNAIVVNSQTGLVGTPEQTPQGVKFQMLINPAMLVDRVAQINESDINRAETPIGIGGRADLTQNIPNTAADGLYRVYQINCEGDTRGNPFYMSCLGLPIKYAGPLPSAAAQSPYFMYPDSPIHDYNKN